MHCVLMYGCCVIILTGGNRMKISLSDTILVTATGIVIVFIVLILLVFIMYLFGKVASSGGNKDQKKQEKPAPAKQKPLPPSGASMSILAEGEGELIAVIAAAVHSLSERSGKHYAVRSIRPAGTRSAWATAGIYENTRPF